VPIYEEFFCLRALDVLSCSSQTALIFMFQFFRHRSVGHAFHLARQYFLTEIIVTSASIVVSAEEYFRLPFFGA
jgi:hypothetical protein